MIIDTIKLIASDLADMSPKTQLEIVKLCKNLCIAVKDYLVENDENIETINEDIENLQTAVSNLNTSITNLSGELTTAEGNIQANANAILVLQNAVATIQSALNNVYSKTEINDLLLSYYTKSQVNNLLLDYYTKAETYNKTEIVTLLLDYYTKAETYSKTEIDTKLLDYYTMVQINNLLSGKLNASDVCFLTIENRYTPVSVDDFNKMYASKLGVIFYNGYKYYYTGATTVNDVITLSFNSYVVEDGATKIMALSSDTRLISPLDTDVAQPILVSGTNIKTINGQSLLGSGDLIVGGDKLYMHAIALQKNSQNIMVAFNLITKDATAFTLSSLITYLYNKLPSKSIACGGRANGTTINELCFRIQANTSTSIRFTLLNQETLTIQNSDAYLLVYDNVCEI